MAFRNVLIVALVAAVLLAGSAQAVDVLLGTNFDVTAGGETTFNFTLTGESLTLKCSSAGTQKLELYVTTSLNLAIDLTYAASVSYQLSGSASCTGTFATPEITGTLAATLGVDLGIVKLGPGNLFVPLDVKSVGLRKTASIETGDVVLVVGIRGAQSVPVSVSSSVTLTTNDAFSATFSVTAAGSITFDNQGDDNPTGVRIDGDAVSPYFQFAATGSTRVSGGSVTWYYGYDSDAVDAEGSLQIEWFNTTSLKWEVVATSRNDNDKTVSGNVGGAGTVVVSNSKAGGGNSAGTLACALGATMVGAAIALA